MIIAMISSVEEASYLPRDKEGVQCRCFLTAPEDLVRAKAVLSNDRNCHNVNMKVI